MSIVLLLTLRAAHILRDWQCGFCQKSVPGGLTRCPCQTGG